ncbi:hypothetical protein HDZ31DRAFT_59690 [Schizophyllum fasciatum]
MALRRHNVTVDDRDADIQYSVEWFSGTYNASATGESGTLASSNGPNASLVFVFPQPAFALYYYGMGRSGGGLYNICIDCDPNDRRWVSIDAHNASDDGHNPPTVLYHQEWETATVHEVRLQNTADTRFGLPNTQITLDRFDLTVLDDDPDETHNGPDASMSDTSSTSASSEPSATATTRPHTSTEPTSDTSASTPESSYITVSTPTSTSADPPNHSGVPVGAIAGAAAGATLALAAATVLIWWFCRRRRRRAPGGAPKGPTHPDPYMKAMPVPPYTGSIAPGPSSLVGHKRAISHTQPNPPPTDTDTLPQMPHSSNAASSTQPERAYIVPRREVDAGPADEPLEDVLPPDYIDATRGR